MRTLKLTVAYEGAAYVGWQRQSKGSSIQGCLEAALAEIEGEAVAVVGAGRTDAGVHALGQVASLQLRHELAPDALVRAVNARLPPDIRIVAAEVGPDLFHARFDATGKTYRYRLLHGAVSSPFDRRHGWHVGEPLDVERMADAGRVLVGEHDFAAFQATRSSTRSTVRTLFELAVNRVPRDPWSVDGGPGAAPTIIEVRGSGFLRHMVRIIVGTLVEVGRGRRDHVAVEHALRSRDRSLAGQTAPPHGLFLVRVDY
ncbi:MAG: tRNA pseudouridine(38-40) synthase TruA [Vicinamibacterales bacterium]|jgi:tRNA pseudouridine38-40 synthase|nr:tRNA pseudouridine(38-40) synthase TruA [Vicinamibacterales bacterium]